MARNGVLLPAVLFDGSLGKDFTTGETFHRSSFEPSRAVAVLEVLLAKGIEPCVNIDSEPRDAVVGQRPSSHPAHLKFIARWLREDNLEVVVREQPVLSFVVCGGEREVLRRGLAAVRDLAAGSISPDLTYGGATLSLRPPGISKWNGVVAFCQSRGLDPGRVLAIGDGDNDVELLQSAAIACAVVDGCEAVLCVAQHHLRPAHEGGWATILDILRHSNLPESAST